MGGNVTVTVVASPSSTGLEIELVSMSGEIHLTVPDGFPMDVDIELDYTKNSRRSYEIVSDFSLAEHEDADWEYGGGTPRKTVHGSATIGSGGNRVVIRTINGDVHLLKGN